MISKQLIEKYMELEEKRFWAAKANLFDAKKVKASWQARKQWNRVFVMYCNPDWKAR